MSRFATTVGVVALGVAIAIAGAGVSIAIAGAAPEPYRVQAVPAASVNVERPQPLDLSSVDAINQYLRSRGLDPATFVVQRGPLNYAGPNCPGTVFNCTTATRVVQIATGGTLALSSFSTLNGPTTANDAECVPEEDTTAPLVGVGCVIVQTALVGPEVDQQASCKVESTVPKKQVCSITQTNNSGGDNQAAISMKIDSSNGPTQLGDQEAIVYQQTSSGGNNQFQGDETIALAAGGSATTQDGYQSLFLTQRVFSTFVLNDFVPATGNNQAQATQSQIFQAKTTTGGTQNQNTNSVEDPCFAGEVDDANSCIDYSQSTGSGINQFEAYQKHDLKATSDKATVTQRQGCESNFEKVCGVEEVGTQSTDEGTKNRAKVVQNGQYVLEAPEGADQMQDPRFGGAGTEQFGGAEDVFELRQFAGLYASTSNALQSHENVVNDTSDGEVFTRSEIRTNDDYSVVFCHAEDGGTCTYTQRCSNIPEENEPPDVFCPPEEEGLVDPTTVTETNGS
jgi:hypothetical protein